MFLRIEGFQVEIKEINKTWDQPTFVKNFKIGKNLCLFSTTLFGTILGRQSFQN